MRRLVVSSFAALMLIVAGSSFAGQCDMPGAHGKASAAALQGYCPVAYGAMGKAVKGNKRWTSTVHGQRYVFANAEAKKMFDAEPARFEVAYDGLCATAMAMGQQRKSDPRLFVIHGGRTYLFSSAEAREAFERMPDETAKKADAQWAEAMARH